MQGCSAEDRLWVPPQSNQNRKWRESVSACPGTLTALRAHWSPLQERSWTQVTVGAHSLPTSCLGDSAGELRATSCWRPPSEVSPVKPGKEDPSVQEAGPHLTEEGVCPHPYNLLSTCESVQSQPHLLRVYFLEMYGRSQSHAVDSSRLLVLGNL